MTRSRRLSVSLVVLALAAPMVGACSDDEKAKPGDCTPIEDDRVTISGTVGGWEPECLEVKAGRTIDFTAELADGEPHNLAVSGPGLSKVSTGAAVREGPLELRVSLQRPGRFEYVCTIHVAMKGDLYVEK